MLTPDRLDALSTIPTSSWAIWNHDGPNDADFFARNIGTLHGRAVLLGLNRSNRALGQETIPYINFHTPKHRGDSRLERFIQGNRLGNIIGAYMTDLSLHIETDSNLVHVSKPHLAVDDLRSQISFSSESLRSIICIGDKTFEILCKGIGLKPSRHKKNSDTFNLRIATSQVQDEKWLIYRVWMHSNYGVFEHKGEVELAQQLRFIDEQMQ